MTDKHISSQFESELHVVSAELNELGQAFNELRLFDNQNTVCKPQTVSLPHTIE
jgi:hypothetical protein